MDIIVPVPLPPGSQRLSSVEGVRRSRPTCDRCCREETDDNPVVMGPPRPSMVFREAISGKTRRDALCLECRRNLRIY